MMSRRPHPHAVCDRPEPIGWGPFDDGQIPQAIGSDYRSPLPHSRSVSEDVIPANRIGPLRPHPYLGDSTGGELRIRR